MCYFILVGIAEEHAEVLQHHLGGIPAPEPSILQFLPAGYRTFHVSGMCGCDLYSASHVEPLDEDRMRSKYRKKGWSESKIERALSDKRSAQKESFRGLKPELRERLCNLAAETGRLSVYVHFQRDNEGVPVAGKKVVPCTSFMKDDDAVPEDVIVDVVAG